VGVPLVRVGLMSDGAAFCADVLAGGVLLGVLLVLFRGRSS
jgi:hypothetical protein